jgi:spermidine/putrescine transport system ATP-binding protein
MSHGRILQIGTPRDIYDRPAERFVANFIGETNFLEGEIAEAGNGRAKVRLSSGALVNATLPEAADLAGKVTVVVRPEHARLTAAAEGSTLKGMLENVVYFGTDTHYYVRLNEGPEFIVRQQNQRGVDQVLENGMPVGIAIGENAAQVLRD